MITRYILLGDQYIHGDNLHGSDRRMINSADPIEIGDYGNTDARARD